MKKFAAAEIPDLPWQVAKRKPIPFRVCQIKEAFSVETLEGTLTAKAGDYLIVGVRGEMHAVDQGIFKETYDILRKDE